MLRTLSLATLALAAAAAAAHATPAVVLDPTELTFPLAVERTETDASVVGFYRVRAHGLVVANSGQISRNDRLEIDWAAGGKTLTTVECEWAGSGDQAFFNCEGSDRRDAYGDVTVTLRYTVDAEDKTLTLSTHQLKVGRFWNWYDRNGKIRYYARYQVMPLDLLTSGIIWHEDHGNGDLRVNLYGWYSADGGPIPEATSLRCTVDGQRLPDLVASTGNSLTLEVADWRDANIQQRVPQLRRYEIWVQGLHWGTKEQLTTGYAQNYADGQLQVMGDHPGSWVCDLRAKGKALRTFQWTVGADGLVARHAEQDAGLALPGTERMIEVLVPETAADPYIDPAMSRAGGFFGQPWRVAGTGDRLAPKVSRPGFETAPPKGAGGGKASKPAKPAKAKRKGKGK